MPSESSSAYESTSEIDYPESRSLRSFRISSIKAIYYKLSRRKKMGGMESLENYERIIQSFIVRGAFLGLLFIWFAKGLLILRAFLG
jgi:hypothetical protein